MHVLVGKQCICDNEVNTVIYSMHVRSVSFTTQFDSIKGNGTRIFKIGKRRTREIEWVSEEERMRNIEREG